MALNPSVDTSAELLEEFRLESSEQLPRCEQLLIELEQQPQDRERLRRGSVAAARAEAEQQAIAARETLREQVAALAVKGAEQILRKEVNAGVHADLLNRLKTEL